MSHTDRFWKLFWTVVGIFALLYLVILVALVYLYNPTKTADAAAVGLIFDPSRDPFAVSAPDDTRPKFSGEDFYADELPPAFADWSWGVKVKWDSREEVYSGANSFRVSYLQDWSGVRVDAAGIDLALYEGMTISVHPDARVGDLYLELFDVRGSSLGKQSLSWYASGGALTPGAWNTMSIPFRNLFPEGQAVRGISGYALSTMHPGTVYFDSVKLLKDVPARMRWVESLPKEPEPEKPATPIPLPYTLNFTPAGSLDWRTIYGRFELGPGAIRIGPQVEKTTGSQSYLRGGEAWTNYSVDTKLYWGQTSAFSILLRYVDDANFVSCAFSHYNETVQVYVVEKGVSRLLGTSPALPIRSVEPWKDARAGASVQGDRVSCYVDGEQALSYDVPGLPVSGSVGLETWTRNTYDAPHTLQEFSVKPM